MRSYFTDRYQAVRIGSTVSKLLPVRSGVPQGSILGPIIYAIVTSSFSLSCNVKSLCKYADDITIFCPLFKNCDNLHISMEHKNIVNWTKANGLILNVS